MKIGLRLKAGHTQQHILRKFFRLTLLLRIVDKKQKQKCLCGIERKRDMYFLYMLFCTFYGWNNSLRKIGENRRNWKSGILKWRSYISSRFSPLNANSPREIARSTCGRLHTFHETKLPLQILRIEPLLTHTYSVSARMCDRDGILNAGNQSETRAHTEFSDGYIISSFWHRLRFDIH